METKSEQYLELLLHGNKNGAKKAKDDLKKELGRALLPHRRTAEQAKKEQYEFSKEMLSVYKKLFGSYDAILNHNKSSVLSFLGHALFHFEDSPEYFEIFLTHVREALKDKVDGNLRQTAVTTSSITYVITTLGLPKILNKRITQKGKKLHETYQSIAKSHIIKVFDALETCIERDENNFGDAIDVMKPSVAKSYLLYISGFDRFDVLMDLSGIYEETYLFANNLFYKEWREFYVTALKNHPYVEKFIKNVPRFASSNFEDSVYESRDIPKMVEEILNGPEEKSILSSEFFFGNNKKSQIAAFKGFSAPGDSYFEIMDLIQDVDNSDNLFEIFNAVYLRAFQAPVSEIYWYDLVDSILSKYGDNSLRLKILGEALKKVSEKIDVNLPPHTGDKNDIHYGTIEHRPIFRILIAYATYHHEFGNLKIATVYYRFLLALNPNDNQGVRYLFAALYAGKPASYTDVLFEEGNGTQNWDKVERFLSEQNAKHHFWNESQ